MTANSMQIAYSVNRRAKHIWVAFDHEGDFGLDGSSFHRSQLVEVDVFGGGTILTLSEHDYWHADGPCDVRGCCGN